MRCDTWDPPIASHSREDVIHAAAARAMLYAARGLPPAVGCLLAGPAPACAQVPAGPALGAFLQESDDTEGGSHD